MRLSAFATLMMLSPLAIAETYQIDFGPPGHTEYTGKDFGEALTVTPSKPGELGEDFSLKGIEYKLGEAVLTSDKVGAFGVDGDSNPTAPDAMTKSFIFANPANAAVGAVVELKLANVKPTDKVTFSFIRSSQPFSAHVTIIGGDKKEEKDVESDTEFTTIGTLTGHDSYTIQITHLADKPAEANIAGARITIEPAAAPVAEKAK